MNQDKDETNLADDEVRAATVLLTSARTRRTEGSEFLNGMLLLFSVCRLKMSVARMKQRPTAIRASNSGLRTTTKKKKTNRSISNQVHVPGGRNDVKRCVLHGRACAHRHVRRSSRLLNVIFQASMHRTWPWIRKKVWKSFGMKFSSPRERSARFNTYGRLFNDSLDDDVCLVLEQS